MKAAQPVTRGEVWLLVALTLACLTPFLAKAVHMDDPLFIWTARHIQVDPLNFYGFSVNWTKSVSPMSEVTQNPPLAAYYMAAVAAILGWSETALHFGFLWVAVAVVLGVYFLARDFCGHPLAAALAALASPGLLVSSTTLMCDTLMLAFWVWSVFFWTRGLEQRSQRQLALAAALAAACALTKYFGVSLIPLLAVHAAMTQRRAGWWLLHLGALGLVLAGYQWGAYHLYGRNLLGGAMIYAANSPVGGGLSTKLLTGLCFTGGCVFIVPAALPWLWGRRGVVAALAGVIGLATFMALRKSIDRFPVAVNDRLNWLFIAQWALFVAGGTALLTLAVMDAARHQDSKSVLLLFWIFGTFIFTAVCNWTVAARNVLPMVPAAAILVVRRVEARAGAGQTPPWPWLAGALAVSAAVSLTVAWADFRLAGSARTAALLIYKEVAPNHRSVLFEGHWGFQYYMEQMGATAIEKTHPPLGPDEALIVPAGNSSIYFPPETYAHWSAERDISYPVWMAVMSIGRGAGFYSNEWGPAPFVFGPPPVERYLIYTAN